MSFRFAMDRFRRPHIRDTYERDSFREPRNTWTSGWRRFFTRGRRSDPDTSAFDRRYEWRSSGRSYQDAQEEIVVEKRKRDGYVVEDRLVYDEKPRYFWVFIFLAILLLVLAICNVLFCLDFHWYSRFFAVIGLFVLGIMGLIHSGNLRTRGWKIYSIVYMIVGIITMALVFLCLGLVILTFAHETIDLIELRKDLFIEIMQDRIRINQESVRLNISSWETHIWLCYSMDAITIVLCLIGFLVLTSVVIVFDNYYNNNYIYIRLVEPFCEPMLWNPYGQITLGQVMVFVGFVISDSVYGSNTFDYQDLLPLVWAGIPPIICGFFTAIAYKRTYNKDIIWAIVAIILQFINVIISIVAVFFMTYGMYENITTIDENFTMLFTDFSVQLMSASVIMFAIGDCLALANIFWALAAIVRLIRRACCGTTKTSSQEEIVQYRDGELHPEKSSRTREVITTSHPADTGDLRRFVMDRNVASRIHDEVRPYAADRFVSRF